MNLNHTDSQTVSLASFDPAESLSRSRLRAACQDQTDFLTAVLSAFLVVCMLAALMICTLRVDDWKTSQTCPAQSAVASAKFGVSAQRVF